MLLWKISLIVIASTLLCFIPDCSTSKNGVRKTEPFDPEKIMADAYSKVIVKDGIARSEALLLADRYFTSYISGCGAAAVIVDRGDKWEVETVIGVAAAPYESIFIQKTTGVISCKKGPVVTPLSQE